MRERILFPFCILLLVVPLTFCAPQTASTAQVAAKNTPTQPKWTEMDRQEVLAKARLGDAGSQMWLGAGYEQGWFGKTSFHEALKWFRRAAAQGDPDAQNSLGQMYEDGEGVQQNYTLAAKWYRKAAEHVPDLGGAGQGRNNLGMLYLEGRGVSKDYVQAYMWFRLFKRGQNENLTYAKERMTQAQILEAERMAEKWKSRHHDQQE